MNIGAQFNSSANGAVSVAAYNLMNSNNTDYSPAPVTNDFMPFNDVASAPAFTDEAGDDYTLGASSPAIDAGLQPGGIT